MHWLQDAAAKIPAGQAIVELGVYQGGSLRYLTDGARQGFGAPVFGVDGWGMASIYRNRPKLRRQYGPGNQRLAATAAPGAKLIRALTTDAAKDWAGPRVGLLFIDADHSYMGAMGDFLAWRPHLADGAVVAFDDYWVGRFDGVVATVDQLCGEGQLVGMELIGNRLAVARLGAKVVA